MVIDYEHYGDTTGGDEYFATRLRSGPWDDASEADQIKALYEATRAIDRLAFKGFKTDADQVLSFPRSYVEGTLVTEVPTEVLWATYELALCLLDEIDPEAEARNLGVTSESYGSVRTTYDRSFAEESIAAGIPSIQAWLFLQPYLQDSRGITLSRVT